MLKKVQSAKKITIVLHVKSCIVRSLWRITFHVQFANTTCVYIYITWRDTSLSNGNHFWAPNPQINEQRYAAGTYLKKALYMDHINERATCQAFIWIIFLAEVLTASWLGMLKYVSMKIQVLSTCFSRTICLLANINVDINQEVVLETPMIKRSFMH